MLLATISIVVLIRPVRSTPTLSVEAVQVQVGLATLAALAELGVPGLVGGGVSLAVEV